MEFLEGRALSKHLLERYSKNPKGWSFTVYPGSKEDNGFFGALVSGPDEVWQLKLDSIFKPDPLLLGTKIDSDPMSLKPTPAIPYGYRKIDSDMIRELLGALARGENPEKPRFLDRILSPIEPVVPKGGEPYAEGPFVLTGRENLTISESQKNLEDRLSSEMRKLLRRRYQSYG